MKKPKSKIIDTWYAPDGWEPHYQFDGPDPKGSPRPVTIRSLGERRKTRLEGRTIVAAHEYLGSYGMGGPGFTGFTLAPNEFNKAEETLILRLWGATQWVTWKQLPLTRYVWPNWSDFAMAVEGKKLFSALFDAKASYFLIDGHPYVAAQTKDRKLATKDYMLDAWVLSPEKYVYV